MVKLITSPLTLCTHSNKRVENMFLSHYYVPHILNGMYDKMMRHNYIPGSHQKLHRSRTPDALINSNVTLPDVLLYFQRQEIYKIEMQVGKQYGSLQT